MNSQKNLLTIRVFKVARGYAVTENGLWHDHNQ